MDLNTILLSDSFLTSLCRYELSENKFVYLKAVRVTLISLGIKEDFVNGEFREKLEKFYEGF